MLIDRGRRARIVASVGSAYLKSLNYELRVKIRPLQRPSLQTSNELKGSKASEGAVSIPADLTPSEAEIFSNKAKLI